MQNIIGGKFSAVWYVGIYTYILFNAIFTDIYMSVCEDQFL